MITLTLLHPVQSTPVQSWSFEQDPAIRIGRAVDNHVVLYSAVVSRYHVEIRLTDNQWEVVNLGTNGTYLDGKRVHQAPLTNGSIMRLARSGPNIQIYIHASAGTEPSVPPELSQPIGGIEEVIPNNDLPVSNPATAATSVTVELGTEPPPKIILANAPAEPQPVPRSAFYVCGRYPLFSEANANAAGLPAQPCNHQSSPQGSLICTHCGYPVNPLKRIGQYQVLKSLNLEGDTMMAWRRGYTVLLKTLRPELRKTPSFLEQFETQAQLLCQLEHPGMPKVFEAFEYDGQPYLVSEMIYGPTLRYWVSQKGSMPPYQAVQWVLELSRLLDYLHHQTPPYIHRQIQPSNVLRPTIPLGFSQVVLVGFGELRGLSPETSTLSGPGGYRAPEQHVGEDTVLSDVYALGAMLVFLLTGQEPDAFYRLGDDDFRLQVQEISSINADIAPIIQKLTHPNPAERFGSAALAGEALQTLL